MRIILAVLVLLISTSSVRSDVLVYNANPPQDWMERPVQWCDFGNGADDFPMSFRYGAWWFGCPPWRDDNHIYDLSLHAVFWPGMLGLMSGEGMYGKRLKLWLSSGGFHMPDWSVLAVHFQVWVPEIGKYANYINTGDELSRCVLGNQWALLHSTRLIMDWAECEVSFDDPSEWLCLGASPENAADYGCAADAATALNLPLYNMILISAVPKDSELAGSPVEIGFRMELWAPNAAP